MPILLAGTIEFVHIEQVSALFKFRLGQVSLYYRGQSTGLFWCRVPVWCPYQEFDFSQRVAIFFYSGRPL
jgi:hypothetical protein